MSYDLLADVVVAVHVAWVAFVVFGLLLILLGRALGWKWISNRWFRSVHLGMIGIVIVRAVVWTECPLTTWEHQLRLLAGPVDYESSSVGMFLHRLIHPSLPLWVFPVVYILFGLLILGSFWIAPVKWEIKKASN